MKPVSEWTSSDFDALIGQAESARLEFKSGLMLRERDKALDDLSRQVSAFANTEGGTLVVGVREGKRGKERVAEVVDGVPNDISGQWLQQVLESNISPALPGIRVRRVETTAGLACFVISIPQGSTAHQARDFRYYARSEFEVRALPDHEVRLRMQKGRVARGQIELFDWCPSHLLPTPPDARDPTSWTIVEVHELAKCYADAIRVEPPARAWALRLGLRNTGELTLRDFLVELVVSESADIMTVVAGFPIGDEAPRRHRYESGSTRVYPGDFVFCPDQLWCATIEPQHLSKPQHVKFAWTLYIDGAPPSRGELDVWPTLASAPDSVWAL